MEFPSSRGLSCPNILHAPSGISGPRSLRNIITIRFENGMPEDFIAIIMRGILKALSHLHVTQSKDHNEVNSSNISVDILSDHANVRLAFHPDRDYVNCGGGVKPTHGIWGLGITALEMAYGSLPRNCKGKAELVSLANNVIRILKLKMHHPDEKGEERAKNKGKAKLETADDQKLEEDAIQKGKGKLVIDDDQEMKEKAMQKGRGKLAIADDQEMKEKATQKEKEKLELGDDTIGEEMAKQKRKEKFEVSDDQELREMAKQEGNEKLETDDEELKISKIKLPMLEKIVNNHYVEQLEEKLKRGEEGQEEEAAKDPMVELAENIDKLWTKKLVLKEDNEKDDDAEKEFSRDFLEVVLRCLDVEQELTAAERILEHPFFKKTIDMEKFKKDIDGSQE